MDTQLTNDPINTNHPINTNMQTTLAIKVNEPNENEISTIAPMISKPMNFKSILNNTISDKDHSITHNN